MLVIAIGVAVVGTGSAVGIAATSSDGPSRRVATVALASVTQTVESSGTITSSVKMTPSFSTSGTVKSVKVKVGDTVKKGQVLAQLDTSSLQADVDSANSTLASAKQQLEADKIGQTNAASNSSSNATTASYLESPLDASVATLVAIVGSPSPSPSPGNGTTTGNVSGLVKQVEAAQSAVIAAQQHVDAAQADVDAAQKTVDAAVAQNTKLRDAQKNACATSTGSQTPSASPSESGSAAPVSAECDSAMADYESSADTLSADMAILDAKISVQNGATKALDAAITTLDRLIDQLQAAAGASTSGSGDANPSAPSSGTTNQPKANGTSTPNRQNTTNQPNQSNTSQNSSQPASAARLAADQAAIDAAQAELTLAKQNLEAATLTSPVAGQVAALGLQAGASSSGQTITVVGTGVQGVDVTVPLIQVDQVKVGQPVTVAADGLARTLHGKVESIGLLSSTSGSTAAFRVTIELDADSPRLYDGTGADVVITTGKATSVVTVPNSAIHAARGGGHTVTVLQGGRTATTRVTLGVAGSTVTQIKSGLKVGQQVVLADLSEPLPSSTNSTNSGTFRFPRIFTNGGPAGGR